MECAGVAESAALERIVHVGEAFAPRDDERRLRGSVTRVNAAEAKSRRAFAPPAAFASICAAGRCAAPPFGYTFVVYTAGILGSEKLNCCRPAPEPYPAET